jgi:hypothetical protein
VELVIGGFCPEGFRKVDSRHPFLWAYTMGLDNFRVKPAERAAFGEALRVALGEQAKSWAADDVADDSPLGRYLTTIDNVERAALIASPDALFEFATTHFPALFELADTIDGELVKTQK